MLKVFLDKFLRKDPKHVGENLLAVESEILQQVRDRIRELPGGLAYFPAARLTARIYADSDEQRSDYEKYFCDQRALEQKIRNELRRQNAEQDAERLLINVEILRERGHDWENPIFNLLLCREKKTGQLASLTILRGRAEQTDYKLSSRTHIGRTKEPFDSQQAIVRRNEVVFEDLLDGINETVSRLHARIEQDATSDEYRIYDDDSRAGTSIERDGEWIAVKGPRGMILQHGDLIHFGKATARFSQAYRNDDSCLPS